MTSKKNSSEGTEIREYHTSFNGLFFKVKRLLHSRQSPHQKIEVVENEYFGKILLLDGLVQTTEKDEFFYHEMLTHPAFISHPDPQNILIIGGGDGGVLKEVLRYCIKHVRIVEIDQEVVEVSEKFFPWLSPSLKDKRVELVVADGNEFIQNADRKFDVVLIDSSDPVGPSRRLHEEDFFRKVKNCLDPNGVVVAQIGSPLYQLDQIKEKTAFLKKFFRVVSLYLGPVPTYPGGLWCFVYLSDDVEPLVLRRMPPERLNYFNLDVHQTAFSLPNFLKNKIKQD